MTGTQKSIRVVWCPSGSMSPFGWFLRPLRGSTTVLPSAGSVGLRPTARPTSEDLSFGFVIAPKTPESNPDSHTPGPCLTVPRREAPRFFPAPVSTPDRPLSTPALNTPLERTPGASASMLVYSRLAPTVSASFSASMCQESRSRTEPPERFFPTFNQRSSPEFLHPVLICE